MIERRAKLRGVDDGRAVLEALVVVDVVLDVRVIDLRVVGCRGRLRRRQGRHLLDAGVRGDAREARRALGEQLDGEVGRVERCGALQHLRGARRVAALEQHLAERAEDLLVLGRALGRRDERRLRAVELPVGEPRLALDQQQAPVVGRRAQGDGDDLERLERTRRGEEVPGEGLERFAAGSRTKAQQPGVEPGRSESLRVVHGLPS